MNYSRRLVATKADLSRVLHERGIEPSLELANKVVEKNFDIRLKFSPCGKRLYTYFRVINSPGSIQNNVQGAVDLYLSHRKSLLEQPPTLLPQGASPADGAFSAAEVAGTPPPSEINGFPPTTYKVSSGVAMEGCTSGRRKCYCRRSGLSSCRSVLRLSLDGSTVLARFCSIVDTSAKTGLEQSVLYKTMRLLPFGHCVRIPRRRSSQIPPSSLSTSLLSNGGDFGGTRNADENDDDGNVVVLCFQSPRGQFALEARGAGARARRRVAGRKRAQAQLWGEGSNRGDADNYDDDDDDDDDNCDGRAGSRRTCTAFPSAGLGESFSDSGFQGASGNTSNGGVVASPSNGVGGGGVDGGCALSLFLERIGLERHAGKLKREKFTLGVLLASAGDQDPRNADWLPANLSELGMPPADSELLLRALATVVDAVVDETEGGVLVERTESACGKVEEEESSSSSSSAALSASCGGGFMPVVSSGKGIV
mmetsp:Transcript_58442/g.114838  ORF Transcript_58442/g.114838 Transcript_58442/m.114838 type:complete len:481 (+) Transcript_58442:113-1555(+)